MIKKIFIKDKNRIVNILTVTGAVFLALCYILYLSGGTALSDSGGIFVSVTALVIAVLPILLYPLLRKFRYFKVLRILYCTALLLYMIIFIIFSIVILSSYDSNLQIEDDENLIIVCGCYTNGYTPSNKLKSRLDTAYRLLCDNEKAVCIVSGGMGDDETVSEAESMRKYLVDLGIDEKRIIKEDKSRDTSENIINSIEKMKENGIPLDSRVVCVSSDFHAVRVAMIAKEHGLNARSAGAPSPDNTLLFSSLVREFMSYVRYFLFG